MPTFRPAEDEFSNPLQLIKNLKAYGERYGIIKIVTPESKSCCKFELVSIMKAMK